MGFHGASLQQLPDIKSWDPRTGWAIQRPWRGTPFEVGLKIGELQRDKVRLTHEIETPGGYEVVSAHYGAEDTQPANQPLSENWSLKGNLVQETLWAHPKVREQTTGAVSRGVDPQVMAKLRSDIDRFVRGERTTEVLGLTTDLTLDGIVGVVQLMGMNPNVFKKLIDSMLLGEESFNVPQWALIWTRVVHDASTIRALHDNVAKIFTTGEVQSLINDKDALKFTLPEGYWFEQIPEAEPSGSSKWDVRREWWFLTSYDDFLYERASSPF